MVDYVFNSVVVSNADGSIPLQVTGCTEAAGPGETIAGTFAKSVTVGPTGRLQASIVNEAVNNKQFCIRIVFKAGNGPTKPCGEYPIVDRPNLMTMADIMSDRAAATRLSALVRNPKMMSSLSDRNVFKLAEDDIFMKSVDKNTFNMLKDLAHGNDKSNQIVHQIAGSKKGILSYLMKNPMSFYEIGAAINKGETNKITTTKPGTDAMLVGMESAVGKTMKLLMENRLGVGKDVVKVTIDRIPVGANKKAKFNLQQGLGAIDIIGSADRVQALVTVETNIDGKLSKKSFNTSIEGGMRIHPATVISSNELLVGKIDKVFGQLQESSRILNK